MHRLEHTVDGAPSAVPAQGTVRQLAGELKVTHYDYNPLTGHYSDQVIANQRFGPAIREFVRQNAANIAPEGANRLAEQTQARLRTRMIDDAADWDNWADLAATDVDALADLVVAHLLRNPGNGNLVAAALRGGVVNALVHGLPARASDLGGPEAERSQLTENEIYAFEQLIGASTTTSRSKGVPNKVAAGALNAVNGLDAAFTALRGEIVDHNTELIARMGAEYDLLFTDKLGAAAGFDMDVRSMHLNGAGWLPAGNVALPTTLQALRAPINTAYNEKYSARRLQILQLPVGTQDTVRAGMKRTEVRKVVSPLDRRTKIELIWGSYAQSMGPLVNYVEFNLGSRINRLMYDYVNGRFYLTAHYNWYKGYNPFFEVTGSTD